MHDYDMIVVGSGPAGRRAAIQAAKINKSVLVVEKGRRVGGVSVHTGTIPSKTLRETVLNLSGWRERGFYGRSYRVKQDIGAVDLIARLQKTLDHEVEVLEHQFSRNTVKTACGEARFVGPHQIEITTETNEVKIIALPKLPRSLAVIGAGIIGVEYATIFSALDVAVTLIEPRPTFLDFIDKELIDEFMHELRDRNVSLRLGSTVNSIERSESGSIVTRLSDGRNVSSEMLLFAAGRVGATDRLNLDAAGIAVDHRGRIAVDPLTLQAGVPHIYAAGDVIGFPSLASTSMEQGRLAACHALGMEPMAPPEFFPYGIYSVPEISTTGLTEGEVRARGIPYEVGIARFRETSRGHIMGLNSGMMKMIFSTKTRRLLGVHILSEGATELIHIGQAVLNLKGTIDYFIQNTFNYPTLPEAYKVAGLDAWNRMTRQGSVQLS